MRTWHSLALSGEGPATGPFAKAAASGADVVILDLEDAVGPNQKTEAREHVRAWPDLVVIRSVPAARAGDPGDL